MSLVPIKIVVADDHELILEGLQIMLKKEKEVELAGEAKNGEQLLRIIRQINPDVVITDIKMPIMDGIEATKKIKEEFPHIGIIGLSSHDEGNLIIDMIRAGAKGFVLKTASKQEIVEAIKKVYKDESFYCSQTRDKLSTIIAKNKFHPIKSSAEELFSERELQVIKYTCEGLSNKQIAECMGLKPRTIESYKESIMEKMGVNTSTAIVIFAVDNGLYKKN